MHRSILTAHLLRRAWRVAAIAYGPRRARRVCHDAVRKDDECHNEPQQTATSQAVRINGLWEIKRLLTDRSRQPGSCSCPHPHPPPPCPCARLTMQVWAHWLPLGLMRTGLASHGTPSGPCLMCGISNVLRHFRGQPAVALQACAPRIPTPPLQSPFQDK